VEGGCASITHHVHACHSHASRAHSMVGINGTAQMIWKILRPAPTVFGDRFVHKGVPLSCGVVGPPILLYDSISG
jgi:hypothetical protein